MPEADSPLADLPARRRRRRQAPTLHHSRPAREIKIEVGKLGRASFPKGFYVYIGSAQKNLLQRIKRHLRKEKSPHWHIDYLLPHAKILSIHVFKASKEWECGLSQKIAGLEGAGVVMKGFGASDCKCPSHLYYFPRKPPLGRIRFVASPKTIELVGKSTP